MQSSVSSSLATKASECLLTVLKHAPQDTVITTLYGLGNSTNPKRAGNEKPDADRSGDISTEKGQEGALNGHLAPNSVVSLITSDSERGATNRSALVYPIVIIARGTSDPKIVALAQSMLIQKVGQCDVAVDLKIVGELSRLAVASGIPEFRALLRLYARLSRSSMAQSNDTMLSAVSARLIWPPCSRAN